MALHYNKSVMKKRRKALRKNLSKSEAIVWSHLSRRQMHGYKFRRQYSVDQYVLDFYCPQLKLAIEIDGESHFHGSAEEYDKHRQEYIESFGIRFLRFTNDDVCTNIDGVFLKIVETIKNGTSSMNEQKLPPHNPLLMRGGA
jgi:very-short-patch-repair endonuclease